jgi:hypothetical protein
MPRSAGGADQKSSAQTHRPIPSDGHRALSLPPRYKGPPTAFASNRFGRCICISLGPQPNLLLDQLRPQGSQTILHRRLDLRKGGARMLPTPACHLPEHPLAQFMPR